MGEHGGAIVARDEENLAHKVPARIEGAKGSLLGLVHLYAESQVAGQAPATREAKRRDLELFCRFYHGLYGHDRPDEWYRAVSEEFVRALLHGELGAGRDSARPAETTIRRRFNNLRHFARWIHERIVPFPLGCPTDCVRIPDEPEPDWRGLSRKDVVRLRSASQTLRQRPGRGIDNGLRDEAILEALLGSGLRVSELVSLTVEQWNGRHLRNVLQKGRKVRRVVSLQPRARALIDEWVVARGRTPGPLFTTQSERPPTRFQVNKILRRIEAQTNAHLPAEEHARLTPHLCRHTLLRELADKKGIHYALEPSGHRSSRYIHRYVRPNRESLEQALADLD